VKQSSLIHSSLFHFEPISENLTNTMLIATRIRVSTKMIDSSVILKNEFMQKKPSQSCD